MGQWAASLRASLALHPPRRVRWSVTLVRYTGGTSLAAALVAGFAVLGDWTVFLRFCIAAGPLLCQSAQSVVCSVCSVCSVCPVWLRLACSTSYLPCSPFTPSQRIQCLLPIAPQPALDDRPPPATSNALVPLVSQQPLALVRCCTGSPTTCSPPSLAPTFRASDCLKAAPSPTVLDASRALRMLAR
jgi:hypothetical protein